MINTKVNYVCKVQGKYTYHVLKIICKPYSRICEGLNRWFYGICAVIWEPLAVGYHDVQQGIYKRLDGSVYSTVILTTGCVKYMYSCDTLQLASSNILLTHHNCRTLCRALVQPPCNLGWWFSTGLCPLDQLREQSNPCWPYLWTQPLLQENPKKRNEN